MTNYQRDTCLKSLQPRGHSITYKADQKIFTIIDFQLNEVSEYLLQKSKTSKYTL